MRTRHVILAAGLLIPLTVGCYDGGPVSQSPYAPKQQRTNAIAKAPPVKAEPEVELVAKPIERIAPGTVLGDAAPDGFSHIVLVAMPRLGKGDVNAAPAEAVRLTKMFWTALLAKVNNGSLDKLAIGYALPVREQRVVSTARQPNGAKLGLFGGQVFQENEKFLDEGRVVAWTPTMQVIDLAGLYLRGDEHLELHQRQAVLVDPKTGGVASVMWLRDKADGDAFGLPDKEVQVLPSNFREDRVLNVKGEKIGLLGIPSVDAFAQAQLAQGTAVKMSPALLQTAGLKKYTNKTAAQLEAALRAAIGDKWPQPK